MRRPLRPPVFVRADLASSLGLTIMLLGLMSPAPARSFAGQDDQAQPGGSAESGDFRPWTYWWWMGSAVDPSNITRELTQFREAGFGGAHIIPIYGAKGWEERSRPYLSLAWMAMLDHSVREADRLGLGIDMTTGSGWCFGGPRVTDQQANAAVVLKVYDVTPGASLETTVDPASIQALVAYGPGNSCLELTDRIGNGGAVAWTANEHPWQVYAISQRPSGQKVKRAAPGGTGHMLNLFYAPAVQSHLRWFDEAFAAYTGGLPRAMYHDSYEYRSDWSPDLFAQFEQRRGYRLQTELPALLKDDTSDRAARVKSDYRETLSDMLIEVTLPLWHRWSKAHGFLTRNEAHGSPANLLDLYALADIPETEMFHLDRSKLVSKFASSAANVAGRRRVSAETGTWLREHFTETLADMKGLVDDLFLSGVNHVIYHGSCYSPDEVEWPGWLFYASTQLNARNPIWRDVPALNAYITHTQQHLASERPDHDILLYWPIYDRWHNPKGLVDRLTVHAREWLEGQAVGRVARRLWDRGYAFDYLSDRQVRSAENTAHDIRVPGGRYRVILVPSCELMPLLTFNRLVQLAQGGATILFEDHLPKDVPGWGTLDQRRGQFRSMQATLTFATRESGIQEAQLDEGRILVGDLEALLSAARVDRETLVDHPGLLFLRKKPGAGTTGEDLPSASSHDRVSSRPESSHDWLYFIVNTGTNNVDTWVPLARPIRTARLTSWTPTGPNTHGAAVRTAPDSTSQVYLQLAPGESALLQGRASPSPRIQSSAYQRVRTDAHLIQGVWQIEFIAGGPTLPSPLRTSTLDSWATLGGQATESFAGTARYSIRFDAPPESGETWQLDLGKVAQSARARLNGRELGIVFTPPYRFRTAELLPRNNTLEIEVTSTAANRIRDLDRRQVEWRTFHDINFVNLDYKPFDASDWPVSEAGLLGPVTLTALETLDPAFP